MKLYLLSVVIMGSNPVTVYTENGVPVLVDKCEQVAEFLNKKQLFLPKAYRRNWYCANELENNLTPTKGKNHVPI